MYEERGLGIWFRDGIENILLAIDEANLDMAACFDEPEARAYRHGFAAAIAAVATAFGIRWHAPARGAGEREALEVGGVVVRE